MGTPRPSQVAERGTRLSITASDFDELVGNVVAVTDMAANCFAGDFIKAYPDAKVVLNTRQDLDAWMRSMEESFLKSSRSWILFALPWFDRTSWWISVEFAKLLWPGLFRFVNSRKSFTDAALARVKLVYKSETGRLITQLGEN